MPVSAFTVTATQTVHAANGTALQVAVLTGATAVGNTNSGTVDAVGTTHSVSVTPAASGGLIYASCFSNSANATPVTGTTFETGSPFFSSSWLGRSTSVTVAGTPYSIGWNTSGTIIEGVLCLCEIKGSGIAEDASSPALVVNASSTLATTAAFTPPGNALLVALVVSPANPTPTIALTDTSGLGMTWTLQVNGSLFGGFYAGIWTAPVPPPVDSGPFTIRVPRPLAALAGQLAHRGTPAPVLGKPAVTALAGHLTHSGGFTITLPKIRLGFHTGIDTKPEVITAAQHSNHGASLQVLVFTGAAASPVGATATGTSALTCSITPAASGSFIAGSAFSINASAETAASGTAFLAGSPYEGYATGTLFWFNCTNASATVAGTPVALGVTAGFNPAFGLAEIKAAVTGHLAVDASSPPLVANTGTVPGSLTTAGFFPPGRSVLAAIVTGGDSGASAPTFTDIYSLSWTLAVTGTHQFIYTSSPFPVTAFGDFNITVPAPRTTPWSGFAKAVKGSAAASVGQAASSTGSAGEAASAQASVTPKYGSQATVT